MDVKYEKKIQLKNFSSCAVGIAVPAALCAEWLWGCCGKSVISLMKLTCQGETAMDGGFRHLRQGCRLMPPRPFSITLWHFISGIRFAALVRKQKAIWRTGLPGPERQPHSRTDFVTFSVTVLTGGHGMMKSKMKMKDILMLQIGFH